MKNLENYELNFGLNGNLTNLHQVVVQSENGRPFKCIR